MYSIKKSTAAFRFFNLSPILIFSGINLHNDCDLPKEIMLEHILLVFRSFTLCRKIVFTVNEDYLKKIVVCELKFSFVYSADTLKDIPCFCRV